MAHFAPITIGRNARCVYSVCNLYTHSCVDTVKQTMSLRVFAILPLLLSTAATAQIQDTTLVDIQGIVMGGTPLSLSNWRELRSLDIRSLLICALHTVTPALNAR